MPHQCLGCGKSFPEGSTDLLRGCPGCSGTRFFYTEEVLGQEGLAEKRREAEADIRNLADQVGDEDIWSWRKRDEWVQFEGSAGARERTTRVVRFDSKKVSDALTLFSEARAKAVEAEEARSGPTVAEYVAAHESPVEDAETTAATEAADDAAAPEPSRRKPKPIAAELPKLPNGDEVQEEAAAVDAAEAVSVRVGEPGSYDINVKSLLEANPVVIERDGVYMIHLASAFESAEKKRAKADE